MIIQFSDGNGSIELNHCRAEVATEVIEVRTTEQNDIQSESDPEKLAKCQGNNRSFSTCDRSEKADDSEVIINNGKRDWNTDTIGRVFGIIVEVLYSIALYREIRPNDRNNDFFDPTIRKFWIIISNNAIQIAAINWCKIFGKKHNNRMHYSLFVNADRFHAKLQDVSLADYTERMLNFRDKFVAHEDEEKTRKPIPDFNIAIHIMEAFIETIQEEYDIPLQPTIQNQYESFQHQIRSCLKECKIDWDLQEE